MSRNIQPCIKQEILTTKDDLRVLTNTNEMSREGAMVMPNDQLHYNGDACKWILLHPTQYEGRDVHFSPHFVATLFGQSILRETRPKRYQTDVYDFQNPTTDTFTSSVYRAHCERHDLDILPNCALLIDAINTLDEEIDSSLLQASVRELDHRHALLTTQPIGNTMIGYKLWSAPNYNELRQRCNGTDYEARRAMVFGLNDVVEMKRKKIGPLSTATNIDPDDVDSTFHSTVQASYNAARMRKHPMCQSMVSYEFF